MISLLIALIRNERIRHWQRRVNAAGAATLDAHTRRDWPAAGRHLAALHHAQAKRNALQERARRAAMRRDPWLHADGETCPPCNCDCRKGRDCPRAHLISTHP